MIAADQHRDRCLLLPSTHHAVPALSLPRVRSFVLCVVVKDCCEHAALGGRRHWLELPRKENANSVVTEITSSLTFASWREVS